MKIKRPMKNKNEELLGQNQGQALDVIKVPTRFTWELFLGCMLFILMIYVAICFVQDCINVNDIVKQINDLKDAGLDLTPALESMLKEACLNLAVKLIEIISLFVGSIVLYKAHVRRNIEFYENKYLDNIVIVKEEKYIVTMKENQDKK